MAKWWAVVKWGMILSPQDVDDVFTERWQSWLNYPDDIALDTPDLKIGVDGDRVAIFIHTEEKPDGG